MSDNSITQLKALLIKLSYEKKDVILASGKKSDFYFDCRQTALHPMGAKLLGEELFKLVLKYQTPIQAVGGPTLGADPLVTAISIASSVTSQPLPAFIIRKEPKKYGTQQWIEGQKNLSAGMNVAIIEDVVTTGDSSLLAASRAKDAGYKVPLIVAVVDREEGAREKILKAGFDFVSLFTRTDLS